MVVGGGAVAERKASSLLESGARVVVISPDLSPTLRDWAKVGRIEIVPRSYQEGDLIGAMVAVAATDSGRVNEMVAIEARAAGVLVNVVDRPELCDFIVPSVIRRGDLLISISTGGRSPALARRLREELERTLGPEYEALARLVGEVRESLKKDGRQVSPEGWQSAITPELVELVKRGQLEEARAQLVALLSRVESGS